MNNDASSCKIHTFRKILRIHCRSRCISGWMDGASKDGRPLESNDLQCNNHPTQGGSSFRKTLGLRKGYRCLHKGESADLTRFGVCHGIKCGKRKGWGMFAVQLPHEGNLLFGKFVERLENFLPHAGLPKELRAVDVRRARMRLWTCDFHSWLADRQLDGSRWYWCYRIDNEMGWRRYWGRRWQVWGRSVLAGRSYCSPEYKAHITITWW